MREALLSLEEVPAAKQFMEKFAQVIRIFISWFAWAIFTKTGAHFSINNRPDAFHLPLCPKLAPLFPLQMTSKFMS